MTEKTKNSRFANLYSSKTLFWTFIFGLSFLIFEFLALPKTRTSLVILTRHFNEGSYWRFLFVLSLSVTAFGLFLSFVYAAFASTYKYRIIYFFIFSLLIFIQYGYYKAFESFPRFAEAEVALYSPNWEIFTSAIFSYFNFWALIPIIVFAILLLKTQVVFEKSLKPLIVILFLFAGFFFATTYFTKNTFYVHSFNYGVRTLVSFPVIWYVGTINDTPKNLHYYVQRTKIDYQSTAKPTNNIVFIVDESVRADHLSLNGYKIPTTPTLEKLNEQGIIKNWGNAVSGTTCSVTSNGLMMTGLKDLPDKDYKIYKLPTIFQYAKAMNYKTYYIDGQTSTLWNGKLTDIEDFGKWITSSELGKNLKQKYDVDAEIAKRIKEVVGNSTGNFIWVNKYGVHQSYVNSYPENKSVKDAYLKMSNDGKNTENVALKYDEALRYNSEVFFSELTNDGSFRKNAILVYTSDHGRALKENGVTATHCSNTKPEAKVPLLLLSSPENLPKVDTDFKASHSNIFATLLDLMEFPADKYKYDYGISLLKAKKSDSQKRFYYVGDLNKAEEGKRYAFDE